MVNDTYKFKSKVDKILFKLTSENAIIFNPSKDDYLSPNYTVNCFFEAGNLQQVNSLIGALKQIDSSQFFYQPNQLHLTFLGQIDINSDKATIITTVQDFLTKNKIKFHLLGVGSNKNAVSIIAYPVDFQIAELRRRIRDIGGGKIFYGPYEYLGWINFIRFLKKPKNELLAALKKEVDSDFGLVVPKAIQLIKNSSRTLKGAEVLHNFII